MIVDAVDAVVVRLIWAAASKDVDVVLSPLQPGGQFGDMDSHAAHRDGMKRLPRKQRYTHVWVLLLVDDVSSMITTSGRRSSANPVGPALSS